MINKVSSVKLLIILILALMANVVLVLVAFFLKNRLLNDSWIFIIGILWGIWYFVTTADIQVCDSHICKIIYLYKMVEVDMSFLYLSNIKMIGRGTFTVIINGKNYRLNYTNKNFETVKKIILSCHKSDISVEQLEHLKKTTFQSLKSDK